MQTYQHRAVDLGPSLTDNTGIAVVSQLPSCFIPRRNDPCDQASALVCRQPSAHNLETQLLPWSTGEKPFIQFLTKLCSDLNLCLSDRSFWVTALQSPCWCSRGIGYLLCNELPQIPAARGHGKNLKLHFSPNLLTLVSVRGLCSCYKDV